MHPQHPQHPYNNGYKTLGATCRNAQLQGLGAEAEPAWYKSPLWIVVGVGVLMFYLS